MYMMGRHRQGGGQEPNPVLVNVRGLSLSAAR